MLSDHLRRLMQAMAELPYQPTIPAVPDRLSAHDPDQGRSPGWRLARAARDAYQGLLATGRSVDRWRWQLGIFGLRDIVADPNARAVLADPSAPDEPWRLFGLPIQVEVDQPDTPLTLVPPDPELPATIANLTSEQRDQAVRFARHLAGYYGDTSPQAVERCLRMVSQALDLGAVSFQVLAGTNLASMADGEVRELERRTWQLPTGLHQARPQADRFSGGHWRTPAHAQAITDAGLRGLLLRDIDADDQATEPHPDRPEPTDPVGWLEQDLDEVSHGQDAASITARLAAIEATLTANQAVQPETSWHDSHPDPYGLAAAWPDEHEQAGSWTVASADEVAAWTGPHPIPQPGDQITVVDSDGQPQRYTVQRTSTDSADMRHYWLTTAYGAWPPEQQQQQEQEQDAASPDP